MNLDKESVQIRSIGYIYIYLAGTSHSMDNTVRNQIPSVGFAYK